jgi:signal recognition particle receptor subunit beta
LEFNHRERTARVTVVYYGPAAGGKTTNLQVLHACARPDHRGDLVSVNSSQGRTILFDLLPLVGLGLSGWELRLRVLAVPGQSAYAAARRLTIRGADAIVFVANSASDRWYENPASFRELAENLQLHGIDARTLPTVFQYNKRDLPEIMPIEAMDQGLNPRMLHAIPAIATRGEGVRETLAAIVNLVVSDIGQKYRSLALPTSVSPAAWTAESLLRVFGEPRAPAPAVAPAAAPEVRPPAVPEAHEGHRVVRVGVQQPQAESAPDAQTEARLIESYVQASVTLGQTVEDLRQQRDTALRYVDDLRQTLAAVETHVSDGGPRSGISSLLARMAKAGRCQRASLLAPGPRGLRTVATLKREPDVFACHPRGARLVARHLLWLSQYAVGDPEIPAELRQALTAASPPIYAMACVPLRCGSGVHAVFLLYYGATEATLGAEELGHLGWMGRGLSASLLASRTRSRARQGESHARRLAAVDAALRAFPRLDARHSSTLPPALNRALDHPASTERLAAATRSLASGKIEVRTESLDVVLGALHESGVQVVGESSLLVRGDACLVGLALEALVELTVDGGGGPVRIEARREDGRVAISVWGRRAVPAPAGDGRWLLAGWVAELHSAQLLAGAAPAGPAFTLRLPRGAV